MLQQCASVYYIPSSAPKDTFFSQAPVTAAETAAADQQRTGAGTTL